MSTSTLGFVGWKVAGMPSASTWRAMCTRRYKGGLPTPHPGGLWLCLGCAQGSPHPTPPWACPVARTLPSHRWRERVTWAVVAPHIFLFIALEFHHFSSQSNPWLLGCFWACQSVSYLPTFIIFCVNQYSSLQQVVKLVKFLEKQLHQHSTLLFTPHQVTSSDVFMESTSYHI